MWSLSPFGLGYDPPSMEAGRHRQLVTFGLMLGIVLAAVEATAVAAAMPTAVAELGGVELYSWVFTSYILTSTLTMPLFGMLADLYGRRRLFGLAVALFLLGSALCGASQSMPFLIFCRAIQGLGAGGILPIVSTIASDIYSLRERGQVQGFFAGTWAITGLTGPLVGGWITDTFSWRWIFYLSIPFGCLSALLIWRFLTEEAQPQGASLNLRGALGIFRIRMIAVSSVGNLLLGGMLFSLSTYVPIFGQGVLGGTAVDAGALLIPLSLGWTFASTVGGRMLLRITYRRFLLCGALLNLVGAIGLCLADSSGRTLVLVSAVFMGLGFGWLSLPFLLGVQNAVPWDKRGIATSSVQFFRSIGGAATVAVLGIYFQSRQLAVVERLGLGNGPGVEAALDPELRLDLAPDVLAGLQEALFFGLQGVFGVILTMSVLCLLVALSFPGGSAESLAWKKDPASGGTPIGDTANGDTPNVGAVPESENPTPAQKPPPQ